MNSRPATDVNRLPPPRGDGLLPVTITHLELVSGDWTRRGQPPDIKVDIEREPAPTSATYLELYDNEVVFFGLAPDYIGRRIGPWLLDRAIECGFARGAATLILNTNTVDRPRALETYRKAGFRIVRSEEKLLQDPRVLWPDIYRWPPK